MQALEFIVDIDDDNRIFLQLPETVKARKAKVIVMYEQEATHPVQPFKFGLFAGQIQMYDDFDEPLTFTRELPSVFNNE